jgi:hypothetical protein
MKRKENNMMTPWFPSHIKPVHKGVYEVKDPFWVMVYSNWNGRSWDVGSVYLSSIIGAGRHIKSECQDRSWRGFKEKQT